MLGKRKLQKNDSLQMRARADVLNAATKGLEIIVVENSALFAGLSLGFSTYNNNNT